MFSLKLKTLPLNYSNQLGKPQYIYETAFSGIAYLLFIFSALIAVISFAIVFTSLDDFKTDLYLWILLGVLSLFFLIYIPLGNKFRYVALFEKGIVLKRRFSTKIIEYPNIDKIEIRNLDLLRNLFRSKKNKQLTIELFLKDNTIVSISESLRAIKSLKYPRIPTGYRILKTMKPYDQLIDRIHRNA